MAKALNEPYQAESAIPFLSVLSTEAILIRTTRLTETSLIVHWLSEEEGLIKTVAKGALRPKSVFAGKLDLYFSGEIMFAKARQGELHALREVSISNWRQGLRRSYVTTMLAGYFCQLIEAGLESNHPEPEIFDLLRRGLDHLDVETASLRALQHFERQFAVILGVSRGNRAAEQALGDHLGGLPSSRKKLLEDLGAG